MTEGVFIKYEDKNFRPATIEMLGQANAIIERYRADGYALTLRQLYYQFVARGLFANNDTNYNRLKDAISNGRLAGLVPWDAIEDRSRSLKGLGYMSCPAEAVKRARTGYMRDLWADQEWRPEVWVEKEALVDVIGSICNDLRVDFFACKGYNSHSEQWRAGQRFANYIIKGQRPIVFHLGDHDPSGIDMTRNNRDRLTQFAGTPILVQRLALNYPQIEELDPPPNPAKVTDSRFEKYERQYGDTSWELDALDPSYIKGLIRDAVAKIRDDEIWDQSLLQEADEQQELDDIIEGLGGNEDD